MKPEIFYGDAMMVSSIQDMVELLGKDILRINPRDPYFEQVSIEKFVMETLLKEIHENTDVSPFVIVERFAEKMFRGAYENPVSEMTDVFVIAGTAAQSMLDDLYFD